jgi:hypothetical protein
MFFPDISAEKRADGNKSIPKDKIENAEIERTETGEKVFFIGGSQTLKCREMLLAF